MQTQIRSALSRQHTRRLACLLIPIALMAAACGGDDNGSDGDTSGSGDTSASSETSEGLSGEPVEVEVITLLTGPITWLQVQAGATAAEKAINASGGINGRPFKVHVCDGQSPIEPTATVQCARDLIANAAIVAELSDLHSYGQDVNTMLNEADVPSIGPFPFSASQLSAPNSFPLSGAEGAAQAIVLADAGAEDIVVPYFDQASAAASVDLNELALQSRGLSLAGSIPVPPSATDMTPYLERASTADGAALALTPPQLAQWLKGAEQGNYTQKIAATALSLIPKNLEALGSSAEGVLIAAGLPFASNTALPGIERFVQEMDAHDPAASKDEVSLNAWLSAWAFAEVARTIEGPITRESVMSAWSNLTDFNVFGLLPDGFTTTKAPLDIPGFERLFNAGIVQGVVKDGVAIQTSEGYVPIFTSP